MDTRLLITELYGIPVSEPFLQWYHGEFTAQFHANYGDNVGFAGYILNPWQTPYAQSPRATACIVFATEGCDRESLLKNVDGKGRWSLRNGLDSSEAADMLHTVCPGDFPYAGFLKYLGLWGGGSGVKQESDVQLMKMIIRKWVELTGAATKATLDVISWARGQELDVGDWKFMNGNPERLEELRAAYNSAHG